MAEVGCWWWLAERRRQWCRPVARWRQPWYSNPIAKGVGAAADAGAAAAAADADADVRAGAGNTAGAGVQAKNGDNTKAAATAIVPERTERGGRERTSTMAAGEEGGTTLDISYPSARNPLTS